MGKAFAGGVSLSGEGRAIFIVCVKTGRKLFQFHLTDLEATFLQIDIGRAEVRGKLTVVSDDEI